MIRKRDGGSGAGLERSCGEHASDWMVSTEPSDGVQLLQAWFAGRGFDTHRHDTYAIGLTDTGVQAFDYRGASERSTPGQVVILHPDEAHDGRAGTRDGFGYRIVYVAPVRIGEAAGVIRGRPCALPFARTPVLTQATLAHAIEAAFHRGSEPLAIDQLILSLAEGLVNVDPSCGGSDTPIRVDHRAITQARRFLDGTIRVVRSAEMEAITGLTRYDLARQFRVAVGTSPYRYSVMRRLQWARVRLRTNSPLADVALGAGFADQAHFSRMFKAAFGITPARSRLLQQGSKAYLKTMRQAAADAEK